MSSMSTSSPGDRGTFARTVLRAEVAFGRKAISEGRALMNEAMLRKASTKNGNSVLQACLCADGGQSHYAGVCSRLGLKHTLRRFSLFFR
jgi:hypothetical protein